MLYTIVIKLKIMPNATIGGQKVYNAHATESAESLVELFAMQSGVNNTELVNSFASRSILEQPPTLKIHKIFQAKQ